MTNAIGFLTVSRTRASEAHGHDHRQVSQPAGPSLASDAPDDLIGGPSAIAESDSGLFTTPDRTPGAQGLQVVELYGIEPWAPDHLHPIYGSAPCFLWKKDKDAPQKNQRNGLEDGGGDSAKPLFANRLSHGACVPVTILDVLLNVEGVGVGERLREFRRGTKRVSSLMKGLVVSNAHFIRQTHNALTRCVVTPYIQPYLVTEPKPSQTCRCTWGNKLTRDQGL